MGMSDDYPVAVEEGATIVRVGRALFGERPARPPTAGDRRPSVRFVVRLTPRGGADRIDGVGEDGVLRVRVAAAPVDEAANARPGPAPRRGARRRRRSAVRIVDRGHGAAQDARRRRASTGRGDPCPLAGPRAMIGRLGRDARRRSGAIGSVG